MGLDLRRSGLSDQVTGHVYGPGSHDTELGPHCTDQVKEILRALMELRNEVAVCESMAHVLRKATFADEGAVRNVLRYGFQFPRLLATAGTLLTLFAELQLFVADPAKRGGK